MWTTSFDLLSAALFYANNGWPVRPLCRNSKRPATQEFSVEKSQIERWFSTDQYNLAIVTQGNLLVLNVDNKKGTLGSDSFEKLKAQYGFDDETFVVQTPQGFHYYFDTAGIDTRLMTSRYNLKPGIHLRCNGGFVVASPSIIDGVGYQVINNVKPLLLPNVLAELILSKKEFFV